jgi:hypothetical protein
VHARLRLALDEQYGAMGGDAPRERCASDAGAHHEDVELRHIRYG